MKASFAIEFLEKLYVYEGVDWTLVAAVLFEDLEIFITLNDSLLYGVSDQYGCPTESS